MNEIRHIDLTPLHPDTKLWRYIPLRTLFLYLTGKIFIPSIATLRRSDPFEAEFYFDDHPAQFQSAIEERYPQQWNRILDWLYSSRFAEWERKHVTNVETGLIDYGNPFFPEHYFEFVRSTRYGWCWFGPEADVESAAMWHTYGRDGAAVTTTVRSLVSELAANSGRDFEYGRISYVEVSEIGGIRQASTRPPSKLPYLSDVILRPYFLKRSEYRSEHEVRFVTIARPRDTEGLLVDMCPKTWIDQIRLSPWLSASEEDAVCSAIRSLGWAGQCTRSNMLRNRDTDVSQKLFNDHFDKTPWPFSGDATPREVTRLWPL